MTDKTIFDFNSYFMYLNFFFRQSSIKGAKGKFAEAIGVQATYVSQITQEKAHLSLEQAEMASHFMQHTQQESHYFLLLVQKDRAGTKALKNYFAKQLDEIQKSRLVVAERLTKVDQIGAEDRSWYYSSWLHGAVHMATTIPGYQQPLLMAKAFSISEEKILHILEKLEQIGLIKKAGNHYLPGVTRIRLSREHNDIIKHHTNWRLQAIQSFEYETEEDLHYSAAVTLSEKDALAIKDLFLESVKKAQERIKDSAEEKMYVMNVDFFNLLRTKN